MAANTHGAANYSTTICGRPRMGFSGAAALDGFLMARFALHTSNVRKAYDRVFANDDG